MNTSGASELQAARARGAVTYVGRISITSAALFVALAVWVLVNAWLA